MTKDPRSLLITHKNERLTSQAQTLQLNCETIKSLQHMVILILVQIRRVCETTGDFMSNFCVNAEAKCLWLHDPFSALNPNPALSSQIKPMLDLKPITMTSSCCLDKRGNSYSAQTAAQKTMKAFLCSLMIIKSDKTVFGTTRDKKRRVFIILSDCKSIFLSVLCKTKRSVRSIFHLTYWKLRTKDN